MNSTAKKIILKSQNLVKYFTTRDSTFSQHKSLLYALDGVSITIHGGETLGLVGESGSGKSTLGRTLLRLYEPDAGSIYFKGTDITHISQAELKPIRKQMQIVFQDPYASLNPRLSVRKTLEEPLIIHSIAKTQKERREKVLELVSRVGLAKEHLDRYPHEFSGGQRQRIGIARALAVSPELIIADEPVSALDVSIRAQILNLLLQLQEELNLTFLFISHDLSVVRFVSKRVAVMYLGYIVEEGPAEAVFKSPRHPYSRFLIDSAPVPDPSKKRTRALPDGDIPSPLDPPTGCPFHPRCPRADSTCKEERPALSAVEDTRTAACFHPLD